MSENELAKLDDLNGLELDKYGDDDFDATAKAQSFLPRLQLLTANSSKCKSGDFPINHYVLINDQRYDDLGKNIDVLVLTWRPKALETGENIISVFEPDSAEFQRIQEKSGEKNSGCMYGPEFLVWIDSVKTFATFFMGTKSARRESGNVKARLKNSATLSSQECKNKSYTWYAPQCAGCSTPVGMPPKDELFAVVERFNNPPKPTMETVSDETAETRDR